MDCICDSCGMPMTTKEDFGGGKMDNIYCIHCTTPQGELKPFEEVWEGLTKFVIGVMDVNEDDAKEIAKENLKTMPAWQDVV